MQSGILDKTRLVSNLLMLVLLIGNIFFSIQYNESIEYNRDHVTEDRTVERIQTSKFLKFFIDTILNANGAISADDRLKLESDVRQLHDPVITAQWEVFVNSTDAETAQKAAVKLMSMLTSKMI